MYRIKGLKLKLKYPKKLLKAYDLCLQSSHKTVHLEQVHIPILTFLIKKPNEALFDCILTMPMRVFVNSIKGRGMYSPIAQLISEL